MTFVFYLWLLLLSSHFCTNRFQGRLGTLLIFMMSLGVQIVGDLFDFTRTPLCLLMITNIFLAGVIIIHDSPMYLLRKSRFRVSIEIIIFLKLFIILNKSTRRTR